MSLVRTVCMLLAFAIVMLAVILATAGIIPAALYICGFTLGALWRSRSQ